MAAESFNKLAEAVLGAPASGMGTLDLEPRVVSDEATPNLSKEGSIVRRLLA